MDKRGFTANSVLEGAGFFLAVFLLLAVLVKFIFFPAITYADEGVKSLFSLEHSLVWANSVDEPTFQHPVSIGSGEYLVAFSRDVRTDRPAKCKSASRHSCLCLCHNANCNVIIECVSFKQFETITITISGGAIGGDGKIKTLAIRKTGNAISIA